MDATVHAHPPECHLTPGKGDFILINKIPVSIKDEDS